MLHAVIKSRALLLLLPVAAVLLIYAPALQYGKVWDDWLLLGDFGAYMDPASWAAVLSRPLPFSENYFRPLVMFSFVFEAYAGLGDFSSHLINILLHGLNSCLLACVALKLWPGSPADLNQRRWTALAIALVFALHPAMSEAVIWIAGRFDLMATSFMLLAILFDAVALSVYWRALAVGLLFLAALLCKEMAITLPVILVLLKAASEGQREWRQLFRRDRLLVYAGLLAGLLAYLSIRYANLGYLMTPDPQMATLELGSSLQRLLLTGAAFSGYLSTILLPLADITPLHYTVLPIPLNHVGAWLGLLAIAVIGAGLLLLVRRAGGRYIALCLAASMVSLLPVLHITPVPMLLGNTLTADRAAMIPVMLFLLGLGSLASRIDRRKTFAVLGCVLAGWLVLSMLIIRLVLPIWENDLNLWTWITNDAPECGICHANYARHLSSNRLGEPALKEVDLAVTLAGQPWQSAFAFSVKAQVLQGLGRPDEALQAISQAIAMEPLPRIKSAYELQQSNLFISNGRLEQAQAALQRFIAAGKGNTPSVQAQLGSLALATDRPDIARAMYKVAFASYPSSIRNVLLAKTDDPEKWTRLGDMFTEQHAVAEAAAAYAEARRLRDKPDAGINRSSP